MTSDSESVQTKAARRINEWLELLDLVHNEVHPFGDPDLGGSVIEYKDHDENLDAFKKVISLLVISPEAIDLAGLVLIVRDRADDTPIASGVLRLTKADNKLEHIAVVRRLPYQTKFKLQLVEQPESDDSHKEEDAPNE